jgi:hypothetical protein
MATKMVEVANTVRDMANPKRVVGGTPGSAKIASVISTRDVLEWASAVVGMGIGARVAAEFAFLNRTSDVDADVIRTAVRNSIV